MSKRRYGCTRQGMNFWLILLAAQALVLVLSVIRESGKDARFAGDKLDYRS